VNVASSAHRHQRLDFDDLMSRREYKAMTVYGRSKLANILFTRALAKRLDGTGVTVNSLHPGVVRTSIGQNNPLMRAIGGIVMHFRGIPVEEGAQTMIYLATSPEVEGKSGDYYVECKPSPYRTSADALDDATAERLWKVSEELVSAR
jgi:retinol dehydrogenase-12